MISLTDEETRLMKKYPNDSFCPHFTLKEAVELGILEEDDAAFAHRNGVKQFICSNEFLQDFLTAKKNLFAPRTPPITAEEIKTWQEEYKRQCAMTWDELRAKLASVGFAVATTRNPYMNDDDFLDFANIRSG
jgi:hypothetical protein